MTKTNKSLFKKNLQQLEKEYPDEILPKEKMPLVGREEIFSKIPLEDFNVGHLRFMIQQGFGWKFLIPAAIEILTKNPFADEDCYDGSLLSSLLTVKRAFWLENPDLYRKVEEILQSAESVKSERAEEVLKIMLPLKIYDFRKNKPLENE
jgi:hypothetical protein